MTYPPLEHAQTFSAVPMCKYRNVVASKAQKKVVSSTAQKCEVVHTPGRTLRQRGTTITVRLPSLLMCYATVLKTNSASLEGIFPERTIANDSKHAPGILLKKQVAVMYVPFGIKFAKVVHEVDEDNDKRQPQIEANEPPRLQAVI
jgi:hypothetical protein